MDKYLQILGAPAGLITIAVWVLLVGSAIKEIKNIWEVLAPKFLGIQTRVSKEIKFRKQVADNNDRISEFIESQTELNKDLLKNVNEVDKKIDILTDDIIDLKIEEMRDKILDFASGINGGRIFTREQYNYIRKLHITYENYIKRTGRTNDEVEISMEIIDASYAYLVKHHAFVEDKLNDMRVQTFFHDQMEEDEENEKPKKRTTRKTHRASNIPIEDIMKEGREHDK